MGEQDKFKDEYIRFGKVVQKLINPSFLSINDQWLDFLRREYLKDSDGFNNTVKRRYFYKNPDKLVDVLLCLDMPNRFKTGKVICGLINEDIKVSYINFGGSYSGRIIETLFDYKSGSEKYDLSILPELYYASTIFEIPVEVTIGTSPNISQLGSFTEYEVLESKKVYSLNISVK